MCIRDRNRTALGYLEEAVVFERSHNKKRDLADTELNLCAVLSQLGQHNEALTHCLTALVMIQDMIINLPSDGEDKSKEKTEAKSPNVKDSEQGEDQGNPQKTQIDDLGSVLAIAYHNLGVEYEHLKRYDESIEAYEKAVDVATKYLGEGHPIIANLSSVLKTANSQIEGLKSRSGKREEKSRIDPNKVKKKVLQKYSLYNQTGQNGWIKLNSSQSSRQNQTAKSINKPGELGHTVQTEGGVNKDGNNTN
eukprot:TRINITY_DN3227_c0_g1_i16.p1 TRINITY_DN3227_c0_g1~~TRINITY_DN3227_c0_g1_i16.p1  ORF type:complete len:275 (+),score=62.24 TRINITY_DN3227_c0_g1_i16:77-826(+)